MCQEALFSRLHILPDLILETTTGKTMNLDPPSSSQRLYKNLYFTGEEVEE